MSDGSAVLRQEGAEDVLEQPVADDAGLEI